MFGIKTKIETAAFKLRWRQLNTDNYTVAATPFDPSKVTVGKKTYGQLNINLGTNPKRTIEIGSYCSIAPNVNFIINQHNYRFFSSWPWQVYEFDERYYDWERKTNIVVEDDVWIGQGATILGGAILRQGCVIGANAIVSKEIPPYAIYGGGKIIKYRFSPDICEKLDRIDYSKFDEAVTEKIRGWHRVEINEENIDEFMKVVPIKQEVK